MKIKIIGLISFISALCWVLFIVYQLIINKDTITKEAIAAISSVIIPAIVTMSYIILTRFGDVETNELKKINLENELLKIKIEQKKLQNQLEEIK